MKIAIVSSLRILRLRKNMKDVFANWKRHGWNPDDDYTEAFFRAMDI